MDNNFELSCHGIFFELSWKNVFELSWSFFLSSHGKKHPNKSPERSKIEVSGLQNRARSASKRVLRTKIVSETLREATFSILSSIWTHLGAQHLMKFQEFHEICRFCIFFGKNAKFERIA